LRDHQLPQGCDDTGHGWEEKQAADRNPNSQSNERENPRWPRRAILILYDHDGNNRHDEQRPDYPAETITPLLEKHFSNPRIRSLRVPDEGNLERGREPHSGMSA
jgi:hypothetical protein